MKMTVMQNLKQLPDLFRSFEKEKLNELLQSIDATPIKLKSVGEHSKKSYSRKLQQASTQMKKKLTYVLNISSDEEEDNSCESDKQKLVDRTKCQDLDYLVQLMKDKLSSPSLTKEEKLQILTAPHSWSR